MKVEIEWIPIKIRPLTDEEQESYGDEYSFIYDCQLPDDGESVLITLSNSAIDIVEFYDNEFDDYYPEDVVAWAT